MCPKCILLKSKLKEFRLSSHSFVMNVSSNGAPTFKLNAIIRIADAAKLVLEFGYVPWLKLINLPENKFDCNVSKVPQLSPNITILNITLDYFSRPISSYFCQNMKRDWPDNFRFIG
ncbi:hypothetical protein CFP56_012883 [Quercus suber]|uniref:Uncharacterized protein n=1 Tax=Quercus suber TaxID=58331 RepID=A0AAW0KX15_QUESU